MLSFVSALILTCGFRMVQPASRAPEPIRDAHRACLRGAADQCASAIELYEKHLSQNATDNQMHLYFGELLRAQGKTKESQNQFETVMNTNDPTFRAQAANQYWQFENQKVDAAVDQKSKTALLLKVEEKIAQLGSLDLSIQGILVAARLERASGRSANAERRLIEMMSNEASRYEAVVALVELYESENEWQKLLRLPVDEALGSWEPILTALGNVAEALKTQRRFGEVASIYEAQAARELEAEYRANDLVSAAKYFALNHEIAKARNVGLEAIASNGLDELALCEMRFSVAMWQASLGQIDESKAQFELANCESIDTAEIVYERSLREMSIDALNGVDVSVDAPEKEIPVQTDVIIF
jgi:hypothetical protein